ncbi:hypothetical protein [Clostridium sp. BNL1100]|uniref:hypothetical protein n=1 Tax=Clostridium sp. BNL1100 TaxID=755731 RepID=UPI00024A7D1C|nr:hypothetical protein [Clostridium sp. BNL1100]AEY67509.1 hypothetical protein Clo1100_3367 [Clostridium sp. BNL1100]
MRKTFLIVFTCMFLLTFIGCSNEERINSNTNISAAESSITSVQEGSNNSSQSTQRYKKNLGENLYVDAIVDAPKMESASVLKAESIKFNPEVLLKIFFGTKHINGKKEGVGVLYKDDEKNLMVLNDKTFFEFYTSLKSNIQGIINTSDTGNLNKFKLENLDFMSKQEAISKAKKFISKLNITTHGQPKAYSIDYKTMQQEQEKSLKEGLQGFVDAGKVKLKEKWTKDDEFYYIQFRIDINGIPCDNIGYTQIPSGIPVSGSQIEIIISKKGIELFTPLGTIYKKVGTAGDAKSVITIDKALETVKKRYESVILQNEVVIKSISLIYTPKLINPKIDSKTGAIDLKQLNLVPCWLFTINQRGKNTENTNIAEIDKVPNTYIRVNAISGEEIL